MAGEALHRGLELALEQRHDNGFVQQLVLFPRQIRRALVVQVIVGFFLVPLAVVRLGRKQQML